MHAEDGGHGVVDRDFDLIKLRAALRAGEPERPAPYVLTDKDNFDILITRARTSDNPTVQLVLSHLRVAMELAHSEELAESRRALIAMENQRAGERYRIEMRVYEDAVLYEKRLASSFARDQVRRQSLFAKVMEMIRRK